LGRDERGAFGPPGNARPVADLDAESIRGCEAFAQPNGNGLPPLVRKRTAPLLGHKRQRALVDAGCAGGREPAGAAQAGAEALGPCAGQGSGAGQAKAPPRQLPKGAFACGAARDVYVCPQGRALACRGQSARKRPGVGPVVLRQYRAAQGECRACPRRQECCPKSKRGRSLRSHFITGERGA
jgi:hypothetical protein